MVNVSPPALLCHKEPAQEPGISCFLLVLYGFHAQKGSIIGASGETSNYDYIDQSQGERSGGAVVKIIVFRIFTIPRELSPE